MKYTVRVREESSLSPNAEWVSCYVVADDIDHAIAQAIADCPPITERVCCHTYPGHDGYYSTDERLDERTICV